MRIALAAFACVLLVAPVVAADNGHDDGPGAQGNGGGHGGADHGAGDGNQTRGPSDHGNADAGEAERHRCMDQKDDGPRRGPESPQGNGTSARSIHLSTAPGNAPTLSWSEQGLENACGYKVYRSDPVGGKHLLAVVDGSTRSYSDTSATAGTFEYFVQAVERGGTGTTRSNSNFVSVVGPCNWVSISAAYPFVLLHPECL